MNNNVSNLGTNANYPTPDMAQMANTVTQMGKLCAHVNALFQSTQYLPSYNDKFTQLHTNLIDTDRNLRDASQKMAHELNASIDDIASYEAELRDEALDEEDKAYFVEKILNSVNKALSVVKEKDGALTRQLGSINQKFDRTQTEGFIAEHRTLIESYNADIEQLDAKLKALQEQRKVLNDGIDALKNKGFAEMGQDAIVELEKLAALGMAPPQVAAVQLALEQVKKLLAEAERTITFFAMLKALDDLVDVIDATTKKQAGKNKDIVIATQRIDFINAIQDMDTLRTGYLSEASKVTQATGFFLSQFPAGTNQPVESFIENSKPFVDCINTIAFTPR